MKKLLLSLFLAAGCLLCGCMQKMPEYYNEIKNAKELYEKLDSGRITMTDLSSGEDIMEFSFMINKRDEMVFSYASHGGEGEERAFSDGGQFFYKQAEDDGWRVIPPDDESYAYNLYSRTYRYPYARGSLFFLDGTSVESVFSIGGSDGPLQITYVYDPEKLNSFAAGQLDNVSAFSALTAVYELDAEGYITSMTETGTVTDAEGITTEVNIKITVSDMNAVYDIPYPVDNLINE